MQIHFLPTDQQPHHHDFITKWIFLTNHIWGYNETLWQCWMLQISSSTALPHLPYLYIFPLPDSSIPHMNATCNVPPHNFAQPALPSLHFLILPPNGCSDAVSRPQIYAFGISHCLAFPSSSHHMFPSPLSLALILYFWDSICTSLTDGRVIFTLSDTYMHTIDM